MASVIRDEVSLHSPTSLHGSTWYTMETLPDKVVISSLGSTDWTYLLYRASMGFWEHEAIGA
jgi:hypothetical protein